MVDRYQPSRREVIAMCGAGIVALHTGALGGGLGMGAPVSAANPKIKGLHLKTHTLHAMRDFYRDKIGFKLVAETATTIAFEAGLTRLEFEQVNDGSRPFYHFAFNIPENKILEARKWQLERSPLMPIPERLRDPNYPIDVVDYSHWNAHSIFFYDPGGNVVEYIARHDLTNASKRLFGIKDIQYASEIGWIVDDVPAVASALKDVAGVEQYRGGSDMFTAMGDEHGLLLVMKRGRILNFDPSTNDKAARVFATLATISGAASSYEFPGFPYEIKSAG